MAGIPAVLFTEHLAETNDYTYNVREPGGGLLASFEPDGENLHYYHFDALGSTVLVTNGSGTVSDAYAYDAWGNALSGGDGLKPYQYVGQLGYYSHTSAQGDALEDLMQLGVRFYDPVTGRFTQRDPILSPADSLYDYSRNKPTRKIDPSGMTGVEYDFKCADTGGTKTEAPGFSCSCTCILKADGWELPTGTIGDLLPSITLPVGGVRFVTSHQAGELCKPEDQCNGLGITATGNKNRRKWFRDELEGQCAQMCTNIVAGLGMTVQELNNYMKQWAADVHSSWESHCNRRKH